MLLPIGQVELLLALTGTQQGGDASFAVQAALQHPFSMGEMYISTPNPFDYPVSYSYIVSDVRWLPR